LIGGDAFHGVAGELRFEAGSGFTLAQGDLNGDGVADFEIQLDGLVAPLAATDFVL